MQPKKWAARAPVYVNEARQFGIEIVPPSINYSKSEFSTRNNKLYFGLRSIRGVGETAVASILAARGDETFKDLYDFLTKVNRQKINLGTFTALVRAGAFDRMGYVRKDLLANAEKAYEHFTTVIESEEREQEIKRRQLLSEELTPILEKRDALKKRSKKIPLTEEEQTFLELYAKTRKPVALKPIAVTPFPTIERTKTVRLTLDEIMEQAHSIGCYTTVHPATFVKAAKTNVEDCIDGDTAIFGGIVTSVKEIVTRRTGEKMAFLEFEDTTASAEVVVFAKTWKQSPVKAGDLITLRGTVEIPEPEIDEEGNELETKTKIKAMELNVYRSAI